MTATFVALFLFLSATAEKTYAQPSKKCSLDFKFCHFGTAVGRAMTGARDFFDKYEFPCAQLLNPFGFVDCLLNMTKTIIEAGFQDEGETTCGDCENSNSHRLDQVLEDSKFEHQNQLRDYLEREEDWFQGLDPSWKSLLVKQGMIKMWQRDVALGIDKMIRWTREVMFGDSHLNADALTGGFYEEKLSVSQLNDIQALFQGIPKGHLGQLAPGEESKKFICAALGSPEGGLAKLMESFTLRLEYIRSPGNIRWEMKSCHLKVHNFSELLLFGSFVLRRVALAMKGEVMGFQEGADFVSRLKTVHAQWGAACSCNRGESEWNGGKWRTRWRDRCFQTFQASECYVSDHMQAVGILCRRECQRRIADYPAPQSREEDRLIWRMASSQCKGKQPTILMSILTKNGEVTFFDSDISSDVNYTNWAPGEPRMGGRINSCVYYTHPHGEWEAKDCDSLPAGVDRYKWDFCYICERRFNWWPGALKEFNLEEQEDGQPAPPLAPATCKSTDSTGNHDDNVDGNDATQQQCLQPCGSFQVWLYSGVFMVYFCQKNTYLV